MKSTELLNTKVIHKMLGEGIITEAGDNYVTVKFASKVSRFIFPIAFEKFITAENSDIQEMIIEEINRARNEEHKKFYEKHVSQILNVKDLKFTHSQFLSFCFTFYKLWFIIIKMMG